MTHLICKSSFLIKHLPCFQSRLASDQSGSSDSENATANQTEDDRVSANQNEDDRLSLSNQNSDNRSDTISGTETVKTDATTETTGTCQELETDRRGSVSEGTLEGRSSNECKESKDENMENEESVRQIKQAGKIS